MRTKAITAWLRAELDVLFDRVKKRTHRPLLRQGDPEEISTASCNNVIRSMPKPISSSRSTAQPADRTTEQVIDALRAHLQVQPAGTGT